VKNKFGIDGMTCESCVKTVSQIIGQIPGVQNVQISLTKKSADIESSGELTVETVANVLKHLPKYTVKSEPSQAATSAVTGMQTKDSMLKTYKPLILIFTYVFLVATSYQIFQKEFNFNLLMNHIMAGFFIGLSFFKFLNLKAFAESFSSYDPIAQRFLGYGYVYPFVEILLGLMFVSGIGLPAANLITIIILTATTLGVIQRLKSKSQIQCACAGAGFNLPLSSVTVFENVIMVLMAVYGLLRMNYL
jgi:copper chaperone CopZ